MTSGISGNAERFEEKLLEADRKRYRLLKAARDEDLKSCQTEWHRVKFSVEAARAKTKSGLTLLHFAAVNAEHGLDIALYFALVDIGQRDEDGEEPIHYALRRRNYELAKQLLMIRNKGSDNLLQFFVIKNDLRFAKVVHDMDPTLIRRKHLGNKNMLHFAASLADVEMSQWLVEQLQDLVRGLTDSGNSAVHCATGNRKHSVKLFAFLASQGLDLNLANNRQMTPLHCAILSDNIEGVEQLLLLGANPNGRYKNFKTLLHFCVDEGRLACAKLVVAKGTSLMNKVCLGGLTALHIAAKKGRLDFCQLLIENGANVHAFDNQQKMPTHYTDDECEELGQYLLDASLLNPT